MSILRQLLLSVTLAIGVILLGTLALSVNAAREYLSGQLQVQATDAAVSLALSLSQPANNDPVVQELLVSALYPLMVGSFGPISYATAYGSLLAFFLLGCALIAVGMFMSSITENQIIAAVMSLGTLVLCYLMTALSNLMTSTSLASTASLMIVALLLSLIVRLMTKSWTAAGLTAVVTFIPLVALYLISPVAMEGAFTKALGALAIFDRMSSFTDGIFDLTGIVYFVSVAALFCFFTVQSVEKRRWS